MYNNWTHGWLKQTTRQKRSRLDRQAAIGILLLVVGYGFLDSFLVVATLLCPTGTHELFVLDEPEFLRVIVATKQRPQMQQVFTWCNRKYL